MIKWDDLLRVGSEAEAKKQALMKLVGREHLAEDGSVMNVLHSG